MSQVIQMPAGIQVAQQSRRVPRNPRHSFAIEQRPFQLQPFMIAPVLPGETLKNLKCQARVVSDPINNPLIGWWNEKYFFYVKHRDLDARETFVNMMLDPTTNMTPVVQTAAEAPYYYAGTAGNINFLKLAMKRIVEEFFRGDDEAWDIAAGMLDGLPMGKVNLENYTDTLYLNSAVPATPVMVDTPQPDTIDEKVRQWEFLYQYGLTQLTYDQWLQTYGVSTPKADEDNNVPELIRYSRSWSYPSNTVEASTGIPSSALSWVDDFTADKDRYFKEPGFIIGIACIRPKVYLSNLKGYAASLLNDYQAWLPAIASHGMPHISLKKVAGATGPIQNTGASPGGDYWLDLRDLLVYGDQFIVGAGTKNQLALPLPTTARTYAASADINAMFSVATVNKVRQDGIVALNILGMQIDQSPTRVVV